MFYLPEAQSSASGGQDIFSNTRARCYPPGRHSLTDYSDEEDETAELQRELEKIKRERAEKREQEVCCPDKLSSPRNFYI